MHHRYLWPHLYYYDGPHTVPLPAKANELIAMAEGGAPNLERDESSGETCPIPEEKSEAESTVESTTRDSKREERLRRLRELHMRRV